MKKLLSILIAAILAATVFTSCSSDDDNNEPLSEKTVEQLNQFESGYWWILENVRYTEESGRIETYCNAYCIKYDANGKYTGASFYWWEDGNEEFDTSSFRNMEKLDWNEYISDCAEYGLKLESAFPPANYKTVCKYIDKEFHLEKFNSWKTYKLKKASPEDPNFPPDWKN